MFNNWIGTSRYVYNRALHATKQGEKINFYELRNKYVTAKNNPNINEWELDTPKDIRAGAINDMVKAFKTAMSNLKNNNIQHFNLQYRKKKKESSIVIPSSALKKKDNDIFIYKTYTKEKIKVSKDKSLENIEFSHDCRLKNDNGKWFLYIPFKVQLNKNIAEKEICSLDPGTRKFHTIYSEETVIKINLRKEKVEKLQMKLDKLQSLRSKNIIKQSHYNKSINKIHFRLKNLIDEIHYQTISYLTNTFKTIFIPEFESQEILKINKAKKFRRNLMGLRHFTFKERLISKSKLKEGCIVNVCTEEYTSKTCGRCGTIVDVGRNEIFNCNMCFLNIDRDVNGARNILIKQLV
jgi:transposase